jgi:UDP:flavonoid glycosyltransferase YjiC (YdhE family)
MRGCAHTDGGAGTLAAGIRAGVPTLVGMLGRVPAEDLGKAIAQTVADEEMATKAKAMGEQVRAEDGIANAIRFIDEQAASFAYPWPTKAAKAGKPELL